MKCLALTTALLAFVSVAHAVTYVHPHVTSSGSVVTGHYRTDADTTRVNNYSTKGNVNPFTGQAGTVTVDPYRCPAGGCR